LHVWFRDADVPSVTSPGGLPTPDRDSIELRVRELRAVRGIQFGHRDTAGSIALPILIPASALSGTAVLV
jgi:hypothetical protein